MMAKQAQTLFLEDWLTFNSDGSSNISAIQSSSSSARAIIQAWGDLRDSLKHNSFQPRHLQSLQVLHNSQSSVYVSDPQAKLLLSILSSKDLSVPHESYPFLLRLLYIWVRKSSKPSSVLIDSAVVFLHHLFSLHIDSEQSPFFYSEAFLLAGALTYVPSTSEKSKTDCLELLSRLLQEEYPYIFITKGHTAKFLAGTGYALLSSGTVHLLRILDSLFNIWNRKDAPSGSVSDGLMILHLIEWVLYGFVKSHSSEKISVLTREILRTSKPPYASFAVLMAAAGVLRASSRSVSSVLMEARSSAEECIGSVARNLISRTEGCNILERQPGSILLLHCISLALARSGPVSFQVSLLMCLSSALLNEIFPLQRFYAKILKNYHNSSTSVAINEVNQHLSSAIFKEAGAISAVFCNQYVSADEGSKSIVENYIWKYCQDVYSLHRKVGLVLRGIEVELIGNLEKIAESAFLMVVVFALEVTKERLHSRFSQETQLEVSVRILIAFSCFEYFRRMRLSEYMDTIRKVVISVQETKLACISFVKSIPSYSQLINKDGSFSLHKIDYMWSKDDVQTARILFYLRVIPTCIEQVPASLFREVVAPTMFLYMGHPNGKVARASHSLFMAFVSSAKDSDDEERLSLKEQLVFFYMQRSLEGYPGLTPFEGMASGVAALVRYLPAGSPSTFYCIHSLVERANNLRSEIMAGDIEAWTNWQEEVEPCKKLLELLMRLLSLVDIQVLPSLMKLLAQLTAQLPKEGQNMILNDLYAQVAESDDVIRKPILVSWLQSLSYLCSQATSRGAADGAEHGGNAALAINTGDLGFKKIDARL